MDKIRKWYTALPNAVRAGFNSGWQAALLSFVVSVIGFLGQLQEWAGGSGDTAFPGLDGLGKAVVSLVLGLLMAVFVTIFRYLKPGPNYTDPPPAPDAAGDGTPVDRGSVTLMDVLIILAIVLVVVVLISIL